MNRSDHVMDKSPAENNSHPARSNARATAAELSEFLQRMKGKSPSEMLGAVAQSRLMIALVQATVGCVVLMAVLTFVPYLLGKSARNNKRDEAANKVEKKDVAADPQKKPEPTKDGNTVADSKKDAPVSKDAVKKLDLDTKTSNPKVNPLDNKNDDLLKEIK